MYKVGLIKECLKYLLISLSMGLYLPLYGTCLIYFDLIKKDYDIIFCFSLKYRYINSEQKKLGFC